MQERVRPSGIRVVFDEAHWQLEEAPDAATRAGGRLPRGDVSLLPATDELTAVLATQDFEAVDDVRLAPLVGVTRAVASRPTVEVPVAADEHAVMLVAHDEVYEWVLPDVQPDVPNVGVLRNGPSTGDRRFVFTMPPGPKASTGPAGPMRGATTEAIRAWVLRFAARAVTPVAIGFLEGKVETGFVDMIDPDPSQWQPAPPSDSRVSSPRVLLFVHGTFSSSVGAFHALAATEGGKTFFEWAYTHYDEILGYDHATLSVDPEANAADLLARLAKRFGDAQPIIDVVAHSRGGLVARVLVEMLAPQSAWRPRFDRVVMVGCTNAGTHLAEPDNWKTFVDLYTNLAVQAARLAGGVLGHPTVAAVLEAGIRSVGAFVKYLAVHMVTERAVPGLAAMEPGSEIVTVVNRTNPGQTGALGSMYYVVRTDFEVGLDVDRVGALPRALAAWLADRVTDQLFGVANDLVVDTASMATIDPQVGGFVKDVLDFGKTGIVHHLTYFHRDETAAALLRWLDDDRQMFPLARPTRGPRRNGGGPKRATPPDETPPPEMPPAMVGAPDTVIPDVAAGTPRLARLECRAELPAQLVVAQTFELTVTLSLEAIAAAAAGIAAASASVQADASAPLSVSVSPRSNVELENPAFQDVAFPEPGLPRELFFRGRALALGPAQLWVRVRQGNNVLAKLTLDAEVVAATATTGITRARADVEPGAALTVEAPYTLRVIEVTVGPEFALHFELESIEANLRLAYPSGKQPDVPRFVRGIYEEIEQRRLRSPNDHAAFLLELRSYGATLFRSLLPPQVQRALWKNRHDIESILLLSTETHVPWELVHICDPDTQTLPDEQCFLAEKGLVRWLHNTQVQPQTLTLRTGKTRHLVPDYPAGQWRLPATKDERAFMIKHLQTTPVGDAAIDLYTMLRDPDFDLLHFAGHGEATTTDIEDAALLLLGSQRATQWSPDRAQAMVVRSLPMAAGARSRPFVFLNACQVARAGHVVGTLGGFAHAFLARGAGAFVAPLWAVGDGPAFKFGEALYRGFFGDGLTLSAATTAARKTVAATGDATWLAYAVYGHHDARAELDDGLRASWAAAVIDPPAVP